MTYILALIQSIFAALSMVTSQKVLERRSIGNDWQTVISKGMHVAVLAILAWFGTFSAWWDGFLADPIWSIGLFAIGLAILYATYPLRRTAYLNEKISALQPFALMRQIFAVLLAVVVLSENVSALTLAITLIAIAVLIVSNMENGKLVLNRYSGMVLLSSFMQAVMLMIVVKLAVVLGPLNYYFFESLGIAGIAAVLIVVRGEYREILTAKRDYFLLQIPTNLVGLVAIVLSLLLYGQLWVAIASLFNLLHLVFLMILWVIFLSDVPTRKNIVTTVLIALCVAVGVMFRHAS